MRHLLLRRLLLLFVLVLLGSAASLAVKQYSRDPVDNNGTAKLQNWTTAKQRVLGVADSIENMFFKVAIPATFEDTVTFKKPINAPDLITALSAGDGITITNGEIPRITNTGVLELVAGTGISVDGNKITSTITQGYTSLSAGTNISIDGNKITNTYTAPTPDYTQSGWTTGTGKVYLSTITNSVGIGTTSPTSLLHVVGSSNLAGSVTLGTSATDDITILGAISTGSTILPANDLGADIGSNALRFNNLYVAHINSNASQAFSGQTTFSYAPTDESFMQASVIINPTTYVSDGQLLGLGIAGYQRAMIDEEGDITLGYSSQISAPSSSYPLNIYGHSGTRVAYINSSGGLSMGSALTSSSALTITPASGSNVNFALATTGDFVVNTNQLYVDTSLAKVGIGTTIPGAKLTVAGAANTYANILSGNNLMKGYNGHSNYVSTSGLGLGGLQRVTENGNLINIGSIQAGETRLMGFGTFATKVDYGTGSYPQSVAVGDLNGDGKSDLAIANYLAGQVSILINNGDGTFATKVDYTVGARPASIKIGDLNGDGKSDLATANYNSNSISILINSGSGTFSSQVVYSTGINPFSLSLDDMNGDGLLDIAVANLSSNTVSVLMNNGDGTFATKVDYAAGSSTYGVASGDLSGDGKPDIAAVNFGSNSLSVYINNGDGTFATKVDYVSGTSPSSVAIGDLNGDNKRDIAIVNYGSFKVSIFINNGSGVFAAKVDYTSGVNPNNIALGDLSGDGKLDIAESNNGNDNSVLMNNGDGTFATKVDYVSGTNPTSIALGDVSGDGKLDMVVTNAGLNLASVFISDPRTILYAQASNGNVGIGTTSFGTSAAGVLAIASSTAPTTAITNGVQLYAVDVAGSHELKVMDEAGNATTLSPHNFSLIGDGPSEALAWSYYSEREGMAINADMTRALRLIEDLSGEQLIYTKDLTASASASISAELKTTQEGIMQKFNVLVSSLKESMTSIKGYIEEIFSKKVHTEELCVGKDGEETCLTKIQLDNVLQNLPISSPSPSLGPMPPLSPSQESTNSATSSATI